MGWPREWTRKLLVLPAEYFVGAALLAAALIGSRKIAEMPRLAGAWPRTRAAEARPLARPSSELGDGAAAAVSASAAD
jgi:hypothetical protein